MSRRILSLWVRRDSLVGCWVRLFVGRVRLFEGWARQSGSQVRHSGIRVWQLGGWVWLFSGRVRQFGGRVATTRNFLKEHLVHELFSKISTRCSFEKVSCSWRESCPVKCCGPIAIYEEGHCDSDMRSFFPHFLSSEVDTMFSRPSSCHGLKAFAVSPFLK